MSKLKKSISLIIVLMLVLTMVAGCAGKNNNTEASKPKEEIVIRHWQHHHEARTPVVKELAEEFDKNHPGIKVEVEAIPYDSYFDKLTTSLSSKTAADVFQISALQAQEMIQGGYLQPMPEKVMSPEEIKNTFLDWTISQAEKDGKYYGLPTDVQTLVLFINNDLYKKAGYDPKNPPKDWDEFLTQAKKGTIVDSQGKLQQAGLDTRYKWAVYTLFMYQMLDGKVVDLANKKVNYDSPQGLEAWNYIKKLMVDEKIDSPSFMTGQFKFELGKAMFYINHPVTVGRIKKMAPDLNYTIALVPGPKGHEPITIGHNWLYVVNKDSKNSEAAWEWVKFMASKEAQLKFIEKAGDLPSMKSLLEQDSLFPDDNAKVVRESLKNAVPTQELGEDDVNNIRDEIWTKIVLQQSSVEDAVKHGAEAENALINKKLSK
ncbi:ABC transporter substrate-binding protein [Biomaibacter acetigenes]|uniref:ABC transporter substrate-binding protein n=1 Tax=Biomaibacter acetigenes TaxID=2316383 RepID=A0A3G2R3L2_9FIRM|nr:ABC transporter substrate-binding protein [Biomaibacter acetigenes]AYO29718.1 ABC transporter substrate-binding protein [Biomaibacter acetigenes]